MVICHIGIDFLVNLSSKVQSHISIYSWSPVLSAASRADYHSELSINLQKSLFEIQNNTIEEMGWITRLKTLVSLLQVFFPAPNRDWLAKVKFDLETKFSSNSPDKVFCSLISQSVLKTARSEVVWMKTDDQVAFNPHPAPSSPPFLSVVVVSHIHIETILVMNKWNCSSISLRERFKKENN